MAAENSFYDFVDIMKRLRDKDNGCPWDKVQTHGSLKSSFIEEACEVVAGINLYESCKESDSLKEELGDVLMNIVLQSVIAEEEGEFTMDDVIDEAYKKMVRRHPHVFGKEMAAKAAGILESEALTDWNDIKKQEKQGKEWMDEKLPEAFSECKQLIDKAVERKYGGQA